jgi:hypothetical protein
MTMRHEFSRHCVTLGSALAIGLLTVATSAPAQEAGTPPKQRAIISLNFLARFKKEEPAIPQETVDPSVAVVPANAIEPLPAGMAKTHAVPASNARLAEPLPPTSLVTGHAAPLAQPLTSAASPGQFPSVLPPSVPPVQLASGESPLPAAGPLPFQAAQSPVVIMMPAGWQPDGSYTFAPRSVLSPEVPPEHWPTSQRNPLGDDDRKGLFQWPQIARKITNSTVGESDIQRPAPAPRPSTSRALFAVTSQQPVPTAAAAPTSESVPIAPVAPAQVTLPAPQTTIPQVVTAQPVSKAIFAPQPKQPDPQPEQSKSRALLSLLSKPLNKSEPQQSTAGSRALFALGRKKEEPAAPAPAVVPQYTAEASLPAANLTTPAPAATVETLDPDVQPPAPPNVAHPLPRDYETAKSDDPKMKWRVKGAPAQVVNSTSAASEEPESESVVVSSFESPSESAGEPAAAVSTAEPATEQPISPANSQQDDGQTQKQPPEQAGRSASVANGRSLLGKHFTKNSIQGPRNENDSRDPWRRQAERDAAAAAEKAQEEPLANSKAILPHVAAIFPALEKPAPPKQPRSQPKVTKVSAIEDASDQPRPVRQANGTQARSTDSYYADPWEDAIEAQLLATERRQMGGVSNRRAAMAQRALQHDEDPSEPQPRVPFEDDELEQQKAYLRRTAKRPMPSKPLPPKPGAPSEANTASSSQPRAKKSYRRLTGDDLKQGFVRPLQIFGEMTKLPSPLKTAADNVDHQHQSHESYSSDNGVERYEFYDEKPAKPAPSKRSATKRQPVYELRQSAAAAANVTELHGDEAVTSHDGDSPRGIRGGRRQVESSARLAPKPKELDAEPVADDGVVTADDSAVEIAENEQSVRPALHIRNKHGKQVRVIQGDTTASETGE